MMRWFALLLVCIGLVFAQELTKEEQDFLEQLVKPEEEEYKSCGTNSYCVAYYQCENGTIVTDGVGLIDIRFGQGSGGETEVNQHSICNDTFTSVCCADFIPPPPTVTPTPPPTPPPSYVPTCGRRNFLGLNARILGIANTDTQFGEFPWMAAILRVDGERLVFVCGASLISETVLVTAAHCVFNDAPENLVVRLGEWDTQHTTEFYSHVDINVANVKIHQAYNHARQNLHNDIALLYLTDPAPLQEHIDTICLPDRNSLPSEGAECIATGWGKDSFGEGAFQLILKQVNLPLVERRECENYLRKTRLGRRFRLHESFVCAGGIGGADTCTGDGGSPLACPDPTNPDRYVLGGAVSWGIGCGTENVPGVYVDTGYFVDWIQSNM